MSGEQHAYGVRTIVIRAGFGEMRYRPWCECGWVGVETADETEAARSAFSHATGGREPDETTATKRHRGPVQTETMFDPQPFER